MKSWSRFESQTEVLSLVTFTQLRRTPQIRSRRNRSTLRVGVDSYRDHGGVVFIDLRDRYGKTQVVFRPEEGSEVHVEGRQLRSEDVIQVTGEVVPRTDKDINPKMVTGEIDVRVREIKVFSKSKTPPFEPRTQDLPQRRTPTQVPLRGPASRRVAKGDVPASQTDQVGSRLFR